MPQFKIITSSTIASQYIVNAKNASEASKKWYDGEWKAYKELSDYDLDSNEEIIKIKKV
jgi:hypothetical protein